MCFGINLVPWYLKCCAALRFEKGSFQIMNTDFELIFFCSYFHILYSAALCCVVGLQAQNLT